MRTHGRAESCPAATVSIGMSRIRRLLRPSHEGAEHGPRRSRNEYMLMMHARAGRETGPFQLAYGGPQAHWIHAPPNRISPRPASCAARGDRTARQSGASDEGRPRVTTPVAEAQGLLPVLIVAARVRNGPTNHARLRGAGDRGGAAYITIEVPGMSVAAVEMCSGSRTPVPRPAAQLAPRSRRRHPAIGDFPPPPRRVKEAMIRRPSSAPGGRPDIRGGDPGPLPEHDRSRARRWHGGAAKPCGPQTRPTTMARRRREGGTIRTNEPAILCCNPR